MENNEIKTHILKIWPLYFEAVRAGRKTFEFRVNDRDFEEGDAVVLREYSNGNPYFSNGETRRGYTGREISGYRIGFILGLGDPPGKCIFSLIDVGAIVHTNWPEWED